MKKGFMLLQIFMLSTVLLIPIPKSNKKVKERYVGYVIQPDGEKEVHILIKKWTPIEEMEKLFALRQQKGHKKMCRKFRKMTAGNIWFTSGDRYYISFASAIETPEGRKILLVTSDPLLATGNTVTSRIPTRSENMGSSIAHQEVPHSLGTEYKYFGAIHFTLNDEGFSEGSTMERIKIDIVEGGKLKIDTEDLPPKMFHKIRKKRI